MTNGTINQVQPTDALCDAQFLHVELADGRIVSAPLWWYPQLLNASTTERNHIEFMPAGILWPEIDEEISVASLLQGQPAAGAKKPQAN